MANTKRQATIEGTKKHCGIHLKRQFKSIDLYGRAISLTYKGEDNYKTIPGSIVSFFVLFVMAAFTFYKLQILFTRGNT